MSFFTRRVTLPFSVVVAAATSLAALIAMVAGLTMRANEMATNLTSQVKVCTAFEEYYRDQTKVCSSMLSPDQRKSFNGGK